MQTILRLIKWTWRAWPAIVLIVLFAVHLALLDYFCLNENTTHKTIALITQLVGGLLILYSIDSNMGIIKEKNLLALFAGYLRGFPLIKRSVGMELQSAVTAISSLKAKLTVDRSPKTIEERLEYLQEQINEVKRDIEHETKTLNEKIDHHSKKVKSEIDEIKSALREFEAKVEKVSIGGIKIQFFGVALMVYGAISGYLV